MKANVLTATSNRWMQVHLKNRHLAHILAASPSRITRLLSVAVTDRMNQFRLLCCGVYVCVPCDVQLTTRDTSRVLVEKDDPPRQRDHGIHETAASPAADPFRDSIHERQKEEQQEVRKGEEAKDQVRYCRG